MKSKLNVKINVYYLIAFIISFFISYIIYSAVNERIIERQVSVSAEQTLGALDKNLDFMLNEVTTFSNLIFFDRETQNALADVKSAKPDPVKQQLFDKYIINMLLSGDYISSVYLYDNYGVRYAHGKRSVYSLTIDRIEDAPWYNEALKRDGDVMWVLNSGGVIENPYNDRYISLIRIIKDTRNYKKLGVLIVNVDESTIAEQLRDVSKEQKSQFFVLNEKDEFVTYPDINKELIERRVKPLLTGKSGYNVSVVDGTKMIISYISSSKRNWKIVGMIPLNELSKNLRSISYIAIIILILNSIFMTIGGSYIANLITRPLRRMQKYMNKAEQGNFETIEINEDRDDEIIQLQKVYNKMVKEIEALINEVKEEQKLLRKNELNLIRAQVNPHFLYNTLDAISALSLLGDSTATYKITQSLGEFYRTSLSSGAEFISVDEEVRCIKSYVNILVIRYNNKFEVEYHIEDNILNLKVLKLILQPIVENAIHHGIRNKLGKGNVIIKGFKDGDFIIFKIIDDGVGMSKERLDEVVNGQIKKGGFGLQSASERISIFYDIQKPLEIKSTAGIGTEVTLRIPIMLEDLDG